MVVVVVIVVIVVVVMVMVVVLGSRGKGNIAIMNFVLLVEVAPHFLNL